MNRHPSDAEIIEALRQKGFKATSQRLAICRTVIGSREQINSAISPGLRDIEVLFRS